jgi:hypothetical protein
MQPIGWDDLRYVLALDLIAEARDLSPVKREVDIAVRLARPVRELRTIARRIADLVYAVYSVPGRASNSLPWVPTRI